MIARNDNPKDLLSFIESAYDAGVLDRARRELERAREHHPENLTFLEWEAVIAADESDLLRALGVLEKVLSIEPRRPFALREKATVLLGLGRFEDALSLFQKLGPEKPNDAAFYFDCAHCFDRAGDGSSAHEFFTRAAEIDPEGFAAPMRLSDEDFRELVEEAVGSLPDELRELAYEVELYLEDFPTVLDENPFALVRRSREPSLRSGEDSRTGSAEVLTLFKRSLEIEFPERELLIDEIARALAHELSGEDEDDEVDD